MNLKKKTAGRSGGKGIGAQSMARGFAVLSVASIAVKVLSLLFVPVIRKLMGGSAGYQVYSSANQIYAFVYVIATAGLPVAISKTVTEFVSTGEPKSAVRSFKLARTVLAGLGLILSLLLLVLAKPIAAASGYNEAWLGIAVIAPNVFICSILSAYRGYMQGLKNMTPTAVSQVIEQIVHLLVAIVLVFVFRPKGIVWAVAGASFGTVAGSIAALLIVLYYYNRSKSGIFYEISGEGALKNSSEAAYGERASRERSTKEYLKLLAMYSIPITLSAAIQYGGNLIDVFIVKGRLIRSGLSEFAAASLHGDLSAARQLINVPTALVTALCVSVLPVIAGLYAQKRREDVTERASYSMKLCFIVAVPCSVALAVFAGPVYGVLDFDTPLIMTTMAASILFLGIVHLQSSIMQSVNLLYQATWFIGLGVVVKAVLNYILIGIPGLNIYGAVISTYVSYIVPMLLNDMVLRRKRGIRINYFMLLLRPVAASAAMLIPSYPLYMLLYAVLFRLFKGYYIANLIAFAIAAVVAVVVYLVVLKASKGLTKEDAEAVSPKLARILRFN